MARFRARIAAVNLVIKDAVEGHGCRTRTHHRDHDPQQFPGNIRSLESGLAPRQESSRQREGQCEHGMLEFDHLEREPGALEKVSDGQFSYHFISWMNFAVVFGAGLFVR
jgi:hypothetical protein